MVASRIVGPRASGEQLKDPDQLIDSIETFIFDCDVIIGWLQLLVLGMELCFGLIQLEWKQISMNTFNRGITKFSVKYRTDVRKFDKNNPGIRWIKSQIVDTMFVASCLRQ